MQKFTINSFKSDGKIHKSWQADLIAANNHYWLFKGIFAETIRHKLLGVIEKGTISYEYYWKNRWYNVFRFHHPDGAFRNFYCNVNQPPVVSKNTLNYVDLDIDVLVREDFTFEILDIDEFEINSKLFHYSDDLKISARNSLDAILNMIEKRKFPFNSLSITD